ncbi:MAG TPA: tetratricopeptide repeat protein [Methanothrix sp.]|nr:tetratricopeptide repeat protein [Methanothrix sp.]
MDQLIVLQEIYESFSKGGEGLQKINIKSIEGSCQSLVAALLESMKKGRIDEETCRQLSDKLENVYEIKRMGDIILRAGYPLLAANTYNRALSLCTDPVLKPVLQNNLGRAYAAKGDPARAIYYYEQAADCFSREGDKAGLAHVLGNLGSAYRRSGDWDRAIEYCYKSLKTFEETSDLQGAAQMTGSIGRIYADMGERDLAARYFEKSLADFEALGDQKSTAWILDRMGRLAAAAREWDKAVCRYHQSLSLFEQQGQSTSQAIVLSNLGRAFLEQNEPEAAREPLERAARLLTRHTRPGHQNALSALAAAYCTLAEKKLKKAGDLEKAEEGSSAPAEKARQEASRLFALAADRYQELAANLPGSAEGRSEVRAAASLARGRSYLALLSRSTSDEKALSLAERSLSALERAAAHSSEEEQERILGLQKVVIGMKEAWESSLLQSDSTRAVQSVSRAAGHLLESLGEERPGEPGSTAGRVRQSLKGIRSAAQCCACGPACQEEQQSAAHELKSAAGGLTQGRAAGQGDISTLVSSALCRAAQALGDTGRDGSESRSQGSVQEVGQEATPDSQEVIKPAKEALLLLGGALAGRFLDGIAGRKTPLAWDENMRLFSAPPRESRKEAVSAEKEGKREGQIKPNLKKIVLADGTVEEPEAFVSENADPEEGWLVPMKVEVACRDNGRILPPPVRDRFPAAKDPEDETRSAPGMEVEGLSLRETESVGRDEIPQEKNGDVPNSPLESGGEPELEKEQELKKDQDPKKEQERELKPEEEQTPDQSAQGVAGAPDTTDPYHSDLQEEAEPKFGPFGLSHGIAALKGITIIVVLLLAVDAVLYLM